ncbi:NAD-dependent epimerase/dehydratase family protein, partial [candidate division KSB1 bacterium]|nr:NAD-dependent epimerase/dehydratase family protein [candidate division KSB1 bacterium]NIR72437.1 NAD-dependent epimerase/dehydratase family protein [candidate division KSB1 bacterium]NIS23934.1 NAD-dependent epimerase/dehydratase family protein [candidate division KSB1 bacterium]NIT70851.1 NAD-dependent epimerase/dehydratase family protein [candidate division KSB1 bacterium]NIU24582.1 NAD-dependent epimerase/dehydratase family protein [candidate division KSB1 bacterium]
MKILVTGGAGFIGSHIVDAYISRDHEVVVVDDLSSGERTNLNPQAEFFQLDIQDERLEEIFAKFKFDVVNHHAAQMDVRKSVTDPEFDARVNVLGTLNLLENCVKHGVKKFIFASTGGAVYGEQEYFPADEAHPTWPISPYGITKLTCEKYLFYYKEVRNLANVIFRYSNVYGPRQNPHGEAGVVAIFSQKFL